MSCQTSGMTMNTTLTSSWKVGTGERKKKMFLLPPWTIIPLNWFPVHTRNAFCSSFLSTNPWFMFLSFVGTMFYRMSWCITYCTYHSTADIIYTLIKSALGISVQLSAVGTRRAQWLIYRVAEYYGWQALRYLGCCAFTRRTLRACSVCVPWHT